MTYNSKWKSKTRQTRTQTQKSITVSFVYFTDVSFCSIVWFSNNFFQLVKHFSATTQCQKKKRK